MDKRNSFTAIVNSNQLTPIYPPAPTKLSHGQIASYYWTLPNEFDLRANQYWAVKLQNMHLLNRIANIKEGDSWSFWIRSSKYHGGDRLKLSLADKTDFVPTVEALVDLLNSLIPEEVKMDIFFTFDKQQNQVTLVIKDGMVIIGA